MLHGVLPVLHGVLPVLHGVLSVLHGVLSVLHGVLPIPHGILRVAAPAVFKFSIDCLPGLHGVWQTLQPEGHMLCVVVFTGLDLFLRRRTAVRQRREQLHAPARRRPLG